MSESRQYEQTFLPCHDCGVGDWVWYDNRYSELNLGATGIEPHYLMGYYLGTVLHSLQPRCKEHREAQITAYALDKVVNGG